MLLTDGDNIPDTIRYSRDILGTFLECMGVPQDNFEASLRDLYCLRYDLHYAYFNEIVYSKTRES